MSESTLATGVCNKNSHKLTDGGLAVGKLWIQTSARGRILKHINNFAQNLCKLIYIDAQMRNGSYY